MALRIDGGIGWSITPKESVTENDSDFADVRLLMPMTYDGDILGGEVSTTNGTPTFGFGSVNGAGDAGSTVEFDSGDAFLVISDKYRDLTDTWTIEFWHFSDSIAASRAYISHYVGGGLYWAFHGLAGDMHFFAGTGGGTWDIIDSQAFNVSASTWEHIAVTYDGTTYRGYKDGVQQWSVASAVDVGVSGAVATYFGRNPTGAVDLFDGQMDDVRITVGTNRYPDGTTFDVPTEAFPTEGPAVADANFSDVTLLCQGETFTDESDTGRTVSQIASPTAGSQAGRFGNAYEHPTNADGIGFSGDLLLTGDFTIELWAAFIAGTETSMFVIANAGSTEFLGMNHTGTQFKPFLQGGTQAATIAHILDTDVYSHFAISRTGGTAKVFVNGTEAHSQALAGTVGYASPGLFQCGRSRIDDVRITDGTGRYTADFIPPTAPFATS